MNNAILAGAITLGTAAAVWAAPKAIRATSYLGMAATTGLKNITSAFKGAPKGEQTLSQPTSSLRLGDISAPESKVKNELSPRVAAAKQFFEAGAQEFNLKPRTFSPEIATGSVSRLISQWEGRAQAT